jgi:hypothetical protein
MSEIIYARLAKDGERVQCGLTSVNDPVHEGGIMLPGISLPPLGKSWHARR